MVFTSTATQPLINTEKQILEHDECSSSVNQQQQQQTRTRTHTHTHTQTAFQKKVQYKSQLSCCHLQCGCVCRGARVATLKEEKHVWH